MQLPKEIFVRWDGEKGEEFMNADTRLDYHTPAKDDDDSDKARLVGRYVLVETMNVERSTTIKNRKPVQTKNK